MRRLVGLAAVAAGCVVIVLCALASVFLYIVGLGLLSRGVNALLAAGWQWWLVVPGAALLGLLGAVLMFMGIGAGYGAAGYLARRQLDSTVG